MNLPAAAAPARVDHPRAVGKLDDLALVAVLHRLAERLPRLAVVGRLLHVEPVDVAPPVGAVGVFPVPDVVEKEYLLRLRVDDERRVAAAPLVAVGPRPVPRRRAVRPRAAAVRRTAAYDVDRLERVQVAAVEAPCVAHYDKVAVGRGAEGGKQR